jgi:Ca-activated chloride channel family protein
VVSFDHEIATEFKADSLAPQQAQEARAAVHRLDARGTTDLGGGYFEGARNAAPVIARGRQKSGLVVLLSDGHANQGLTDPGALGRHAAELKARGIATSTVGIGEGYSPLQLDALAENGGGNLHHCDLPEDIVDVILGELGEARNIELFDAQLELVPPRGFRLEVLGSQAVRQDGRRTVISLGDVRAGRRIEVSALLTGDGSEQPGTTAAVEATLSWRGTEDAETREVLKEGRELRVVHHAEFDRSARDAEVAGTVAKVWSAGLAYEATLRNERGDYRGAAAFLDQVLERFGRFVDGLPEAWNLTRRLKGLRRRAQEPEWHGAEKRLLLDLAKKTARSASEPRRNPKGDWFDYIPDGER